MQIAARTGTMARRGAPLPYLRRVACLISNGTQYIDTGITGYPKHDFGASIEPKSSSGTLFGVRYGTRRCAVYSDGRFRNYNNEYANFTLDTGLIHKIEINKTSNEVAVDDVTQSFNFFWSSSASGNPNIYLFALGYNGTASEFSSIAVYSFSIDSDLDLIPVLDLSGRPCMYNQAPSAVPADDPSRFFYNQGTGDDFDWDEL